MARDDAQVREAAERLRQWALDVQEAYADGGYAAGDCPPWIDPADVLLIVGE